MEHMKGLAAIVALGAVALSATGARAAGDTCLQRFVWREASSIDHVCVSPQTRTEARADNAAALSRANPNAPRTTEPASPPNQRLTATRQKCVTTQVVLDSSRKAQGFGRGLMGRGIGRR
jgi:delta 1-pyrroline-5-carboxylate dehydrogenase